MSEMALRLIAQAKRERWTVLDLVDCGIKGQLPLEVCQLKHVEELILGERILEKDSYTQRELYREWEWEWNRN